MRYFTMEIPPGQISSERIQAQQCESCGAAAAVRLRDGSTWCDECNDAAQHLGYDDGA